MKVGQHVSVSNVYSSQGYDRTAGICLPRENIADTSRHNAKLVVGSATVACSRSIAAHIEANTIGC